MPRPIDRRTFLRGAGTLLALPWLEAMLPGTARAAVAGQAPRRLAFIFFPNGAIMPDWTPQQTGKGFELSKTLQPLAPVKDDLLVLSGLAHDKARANGDGPGDHARCAAAYLTGSQPRKTAGADIRVGQSVDQVAADDIGGETRLPSLELGLESGRQAGSCDSGYSCAYSSNISWKTESTPMAKEIDPRAVFQRLFGTSQADVKAEARRAFYRSSILDFVAEDAERLRRQLGQTDRRKIEEYFTSVREIEQRIDRSASEQSLNVADIDLDLPAGIPQETAEHIRLMYDLMALAFQTDSTRVATFMLANAGSNRTYPSLGVNEGHHELSHHRGDDEKIGKIQRIDQFLVEQFSYFLQKLKGMREGEGTLLDRCMIVYGSAISDANRHDHHDLPILLAGRGGSTLPTGQHLRVSRETPMSNLFLSLLDRAGAKVDSFGDATSRLTELDA
jgi:hypothetical protein